MSQRRETILAADARTHAPVFAALGDRTRLRLLGQLSAGEPCSISGLTRSARVTRQAITKHLRVLEEAGLVASTRKGRETRFRFVPEPLDATRDYLTRVSVEWEQALSRLKAFVEK